MSDPGLYEWLVLRRIHDGGIATSAGVYLDQGGLAPGYLTETFDQLIRAGLATVAAGNPVWHLRRVSLTEAGIARHAALCEQHRLPAPDVFDPELGRTGTSVSDPGTPSSAGFSCPQVSHHRTDLAEGYCGACHDFTGAAGSDQMWWARAEGGHWWHAVATCDVSAAPARGWTEGLCGVQLPVSLALFTTPGEPVCLACHVGVVADLRDPESAL